MQSIDETLFRAINGLAGHSQALDWLMSHLANDYFIPPLIAIIAFSLWFMGQGDKRRQNQWAFIYGCVGLGFTGLVVALIDAHYFRPRPYIVYPQIVPLVQRLFYLPTVSSFPSYPAAVFAAMAFGVFLANRVAGLVLFLLMAAMSFSRFYVGVHYPSDIIGGILIGLVVTYASYRVMRLLKPVVGIGFWILEHLFMA